MNSVMRATIMGTALATPTSDLQRAHTKVPRSDFIGDNFAEMSRVLSKHLRSMLSDDTVRDCASFAISDLRSLQILLASKAEREFLDIYDASHDNRRERHASIEEMAQHWDRLLHETPAETHHVLRDSLCHDVVMRFAHHTTESTRQQLAAARNFAMPSLPMAQHSRPRDSNATAAYREYVAASGCQACHSRLVPLPQPEPSATCESQLTAQCFKRGQLGKDACSACVAKHASALSSCSSTETTAWCDHPPACKGMDECPVWPKEFSAPFTLFSSVPHVTAAKSNFYYKYTTETQVQTVDYYEHCFPFVNTRSALNDLPCKLFFQPAGIYLTQPGRVDCCKFVDGVGAVPPEFLQSYTYDGPDTAPDMYGNTVQCDKWSGPDGFKYWTVGHNDTVYKNFGHDIVFQDGPTGVTWRWGNFKVEPQTESLFKLPAGKCEESCPKFFTSEEMNGLLRDAHVRRSLHRHQKHENVHMMEQALLV